MFNVGKLDCKVRIYKHGFFVDDDLGTDEPGRFHLKTIWADVTPRTASLLTGRDAQTMLAKTTHVITCRAEALKDITNDCEIEWTDVIGNNHLMSIDYILPPVRGERFSTIYCSEEV